MNYQKIYDSLIQKRRDYPILKTIQYCESHHIIPASLNGDNNESNKINLTAREHYVAHLLLVKITEFAYGKDSEQYAKMIRAVTYFKTCNNSNKLANRKVINFNNRIYEKIRQEFAKIESKHKTGLLVGKEMECLEEKEQKKKKKNQYHP